MKAKTKPLLGLILLAALLQTGACANNSLEGSIADALSLHFDRVRITKQEEFLVTEYLRDSLRGTERVCRLSLDTQGLDLPNGGSYAVEDDLFLASVELQRTTFENDRFPDTEHGHLRFDSLRFRDGGSAEGEFLFVFADSNTLRGSFASDIVELEP